MISTSDVRAKLLAASEVSAIVATRIYPKYRPQNSTLPAVVLHTVTGNLDQSYQGPMGTQARQFQVDCMATTKVQAEVLRDKVLAALIKRETVGGAVFQGGFINVFRDDFEDTASGPVHTEQVRATLWFN